LGRQPSNVLQAYSIAQAVISLLIRGLAIFWMHRQNQVVIQMEMAIVLNQRKPLKSDGLRKYGGI
jgi:hypothetical protein